MLTAAALASDARLVQRCDAGDGWDIKGDPTEGALVVAAAKAGLDKDDLDAALPARARNPLHLRNQAHDHPAPGRMAGWSPMPRARRR